ncbi:exonuclease SbcCD subunit D [Virgibacillus halophilus]|uniref:DNA repair exonuclease n=1 Tax=Tigheibacillus halophilus TaxID=361280 RepID=A0ABU5C9M0_9BACI|nr:DNA repair exonuclease [Virgibacillus halophilus]
MPEEVSFIHAADLHLDSPFKGLIDIPENILQEIRESTFKALDQLVEQAIRLRVDFVLLAGDLFDNERQSLKAQLRLRHAFERLKTYDIPIYLSYGNHDYLQGNIHPVSYPDNVYIFPDGQIRHFVYEKNGKKLTAIYGFSYEQRAVTENMAKRFHTMRDDGQIPYHIAMLHGSLGHSTEHDTYAPFQITDMTEKSFDYWALGHIHQREIVREQHPVIVYPGNTQGRSIKESGQRGCYHVMMRNQKTTLSFLPLASVEFHTLEITVNHSNEIHELERLILERIQQIKSTTVAQLVKLKLIAERFDFYEELIEIVNEQIMHDTCWQYIYRFELQTLDKGAMVKGQSFVGELAEHFSEVSIQPYIQELFSHKIARKYLPAVTFEEEKSWKEEAQALLLQELLRQ